LTPVPANDSAVQRDGYRWHRRRSIMRPLNRLPICVLLMFLVLSLARPTPAQTITPQGSSTSNVATYWDDPLNWKQQFVPDSQLFWDNSKYWTTNFGPAYRDTTEKGSQFLKCSSQFALCFESGKPPLPCTLSPDGRSADCTCLVFNNTNYVLATAILNYPVYQSTVQACFPNGTTGPNTCKATNTAPVCQYLPGGALIPGADVLSTYDPLTQQTLGKALDHQALTTTCAKGPFAGCMTAPCTLDSAGTTATCKCPVFYGRFTLAGSGAQCSLGGNFVPSASYIPGLDPNPYQ
jgi:hypothetical protein